MYIDTHGRTLVRGTVMYRRPRRDEWYGPSYGHHYSTAHWPISSLSRSLYLSSLASFSSRRLGLSLSIQDI